MTIAEPSTIQAGDTVSWVRDDLAALYPAPTWSLTYYFRGLKQSFNVTAAASGEAFAVGAAAAVTAAWNPGPYQWTAKVTDGTAVHTVSSGTTEIKPDLAQAGAGEFRQHADKVLAAIQAMMERRASKDQQSYTIGGRSLSRMTIAELIVFRDDYRRQVAQLRRDEKLAAGLGSSRRVLTRFGGV